MGAPTIKARLGSLSARIGSLVRAIEESDEATIEEAVLRLSGSRRVLAFVIGAFALLLDGIRLLVRNWRLMLVQILPAVWIWLAMADLKAHMLHGHSFNVLRGPVMPDSAVYEGPDAVAEHFRDLNETLGFMQVQVEAVAPGEDEVFVRLRVHIDAPLGGIGIDGPIYESVQVKRGKLSRIRLYLDESEARHAAGLQA